MTSAENFGEARTHEDRTHARRELVASGVDERGWWRLYDVRMPCGGYVSQLVRVGPQVQDSAVTVTQ